MELLSPPEPPPLPHPREAAEGALRRPLGQPELARFLEPGDRVALVAPVSRGPEDLDFGVEAVLEMAARVRVAAIGVYGAHDAGAPHRHLVPGARLLRPVAEADKLVILSRIAFCPFETFSGGLDALEAVAADEATRREPRLRLAWEAALPPSFLLEVAYQRGGRPSAVFAGAPDAAHRAARAHWGKWRSLPVGAGFEGLALQVEEAGATARALLLAARGLREGGSLAVVGPPASEVDVRHRAALEALRAEASIDFVADLDEARALLRSRHPRGRLGHLPDPLRTLLVVGPERLP